MSQHMYVTRLIWPFILEWCQLRRLLPTMAYIIMAAWRIWSQWSIP